MEALFDEVIEYCKRVSPTWYKLIISMSGTLRQDHFYIKLSELN